MKTKTPRGKTVKKVVNGGSVKPSKNIPLDYSASIKILGKTYTSKGATAREAIENLKADRAKGMGILIVSNGKTKKERILNSRQTFQLFSASRMMREIGLKNTSIFFDF